ncbi:hypothetical protein [Pedobacter sp. SYP-B3415]|uniref:hypothetical protein n=1 Tax=Pedobacter sp. SYP-B3415 TaxID=2496641 RepID=UPI00101BCEF4|nr:hypothetical protein [Pedobacter sp. SYP-B3415]
MNAREERLRNARRHAEMKLTSDRHLQDVVRMAASVCHVPYAWLCLTDEGGPQVVASEGISPKQLHPLASFLTGLPDQPEVFFANFAERNPQFHAHPVVTGSPAVRFIAGVPVRLGKMVRGGCLFIMDRNARILDSVEQQSLLTLSAQISLLMDLHSAVKILEDENDAIEQTRMALHSIYESDQRFHVLLDHDRRILNNNALFEEFIKNRYGEKMRRGQLFSSYIDSDCLSDFLEGFIGAINGELVHQKSGAFFRADKLNTWREITYAPVKNWKGRVIGVSFTAIDIREKIRRDEQIIHQKQMLNTIAEMQSHQIRKPVASIIGLLELMKTDDKGADAVYLDLMEKSIMELDGKIRAIVDHSSGKPEPPTAET